MPLTPGGIPLREGHSSMLHARQSTSHVSLESFGLLTLDEAYVFAVTAQIDPWTVETRCKMPKVSHVV